MTPFGLVCMVLCTAWALISGFREVRLCKKYNRPSSEWTVVCLLLFVLFAGMTANGVFIITSEGFK